MANPRLPKRPVNEILIGLKVLLVGLMLLGAFFPSVGGFEGKGMGYRLPVFVAPALVVPIRWLRGKVWSVGLDIALTLPFLLDTLGNLFGWFDAWNSFDNVLHFLNWFVLVWGITIALNAAGDKSRNSLVWTAGTGIGAIAAIGWEIAEYRIMQSGVGNLRLTYADTLGDLFMGTLGGALGAWLAVGWTPAWTRANWRH